MNSIRTFNAYLPSVGRDVFIDSTASVTGQVILEDDTSVWPMVSIRGDLLPIHIGARSNIQDGSILHTTQKSPYNPEGFALTIGNDTTIGHGVILHGCAIGKLCLVGMGTIILDGALLQDQVLVGAGSLVPPGKILESGFLYLGNPVKKIRPLSEAELNFFAFSSQKYVELKNQHLAEV